MMGGKCKTDVTAKVLLAAAFIINGLPCPEYLFPLLCFNFIHIIIIIIIVSISIMEDAGGGAVKRVFKRGRCRVP